MVYERIDMLITVFTPTYNRVQLLSRLFDSLCKQTFKDFEWVIVDDGSADETRSLSLSLPSRKGVVFPIRYFYQENGGKHRAINRGVKEARGELFFIVDSDDILPPDALQMVAEQYEGIKGDKRFAGVCGLDGTFKGDVIGSGLPAEVLDVSSVAVRFKFGVTGDMKEVFKTEVLREFPFPEIVDEKFCPEMLVWNRIATKYMLRYFNQIIYLVEYQNDGITSNIIKARMKSPIATMMTYSELLNYDVPSMIKMKSAINYWRFRFCSKAADIPKANWRYYWTLPIGYLMHLKDLRTM